MPHTVFISVREHPILQAAGTTPVRVPHVIASPIVRPVASGAVTRHARGVAAWPNSVLAFNVKVQDFKETFKSESLSLDKLSEIHSVLNIPVPDPIILTDNGTDEIKMWISFLIPKIEDGNNFGVSIQEETLGEARQVESDAATYLDQISRYFISRGKLVSKVAKYPHIDDYRQNI
ncbi:PSME3-like protein [Mya arenaria]|uniref:PSME3-like protein n=1 Tax=Mya arenaria TaxID=6604 RepID=A0ABY7DAN0_MYAAR|nr:PSME3-like protein [Mya arenaria]